MDQIAPNYDLFFLLIPGRTSNRSLHDVPPSSPLWIIKLEHSVLAKYPENRDYVAKHKYLTAKYRAVVPSAPVSLLTYDCEKAFLLKWETGMNKIPSPLCPCKFPCGT